QPPHRIGLLRVRRLPDTKWSRSNRSASASLQPENIQSWTLAPAPSPIAIPLISVRSGRVPCLNPGHEPVQELVPTFGEPSFEVSGGDPTLREREERPSIQPLK